jgi:hypothetical protein
MHAKFPSISTGISSWNRRDEVSQSSRYQVSLPHSRFLATKARVGTKSRNAKTEKPQAQLGLRLFYAHKQKNTKIADMNTTFDFL